MAMVASAGRKSSFSASESFALVRDMMKGIAARHYTVNGVQFYLLDSTRQRPAPPDKRLCSTDSTNHRGQFFVGHYAGSGTNHPLAWGASEPRTVDLAMLSQ